MFHYNYFDTQVVIMNTLLQYIFLTSWKIWKMLQILENLAMRMGTWKILIANENGIVYELGLQAALKAAGNVLTKVFYHVICMCY